MPDAHGNPRLAEYLAGREPIARPPVDEAIADAEAAGVYDRAVYEVDVTHFGALGLSEASAVEGPLRGRQAVEDLIRWHVSLLGRLIRDGVTGAIIAAERAA